MSENMELKEVLIYYSGRPIGKPRMTRSDKWRDPPRPAVKRWWDFKNGLMAAALEQGFRPGRMKVISLAALAYFKMPESWSKTKKNELTGKMHQHTPDLSNIIKAVEDALVDDDSSIAVYGPCMKLWGNEDGLTIRVEVEETD